MTEDTLAIVREESTIHQVQAMTRCRPPFLLTEFAELVRDHDRLVRVDAFSTVGKEHCLGHFGPRDDQTPAVLRVPLLHLSRCMMTAGMIAAAQLVPGLVPVAVSTGQVKANSNNLFPPPAFVRSHVDRFRLQDGALICNGYARIQGYPYAEMQDLTLALVPEAAILPLVSDQDDTLPAVLTDGWTRLAWLDQAAIEALILERAPFHRLREAALYRAADGSLRVLTVSTLHPDDCAGELPLTGPGIATGLDYARLMALTAEILAAWWTRETTGQTVVPLAVRVERVETPNLLFLAPPATVIAEATVSAAALDPGRARRLAGRLFTADHTSAWVSGIAVSRMQRIRYALVPEAQFLAG